jgi:hypothetical protein
MLGLKELNPYSHPRYSTVEWNGKTPYNATFPMHW